MRDNVFAGSSILSRFIVKRDKIRLGVWILAIAGFLIAFVPVFQNLFQSGSAGEREVTVAMMQNPAMIAIVGPVYGAANYTTGAMYANFMLVFSVMIAAVMNIFLVTRHTRHDEELGRLEVIRSLPVGRLSNLASTLMVALVLNIVLSVITGVGMYIVREDGMNFVGCMMFGICLGVIGLFFAVATAFFCQLTSNNRTATTMTYFFLLILYMMRAAGDINDNMSALSAISPLGLILHTKNMVENNWYPIFIILGITAALLVVTFILASIRDLNRGLFPERPGRKHASALLSTPYGLALKLLKTPIIIWAITIFALAAMYGSVFGDLDSFIGGNDMLKAIFEQNPKYSAAEQFMSLLMIIMSIIAAIPVISFIGKVASEEKRGHAENIFGKSVSRGAQMASYLIPTLVMAVVFQFLTAFGFWAIGSQVLPETPSLHVFLVSAFAYLPSLLFLVGLMVVLTAFLPDKTFASYLVLGYSFFVVYLGTIAGFPEWTTKLTPFGYVTKYPMEKLKILPLVVITAISIVMMAVGFIGYRKRDLKSPS